MAEKDIRFNLSKKRVFEVVQNGKVELLIANKDFTSFRTLDQLIKMQGTTEVKVIKVWDICVELQALKENYLVIYKKCGLVNKKGEYVDEAKLKGDKLEQYKKFEEERKNKAKEIIGDANDYLANIGSEIQNDGSMVKYSSKYEASILNAGPNLYEVQYFLPTGENLVESKGPKSIIESINRLDNFYSMKELEEYKKERQLVCDYEISIEKEEKEKEENTEKYLEF